MVLAFVLFWVLFWEGDWRTVGFLLIFFFITVLHVFLWHCAWNFLVSQVNNFQNVGTMQSHMYHAFVQTPHSSVFPGTFLFSSGYQKISARIIYSLSISLLYMLQKQLLIEAGFASICKTNDTRAQQMQVSCLRSVNVDFSKSSYKRRFSWNLDAKYFEGRLLQRKFQSWWWVSEVLVKWQKFSCFNPHNDITVQTYSDTWLWYAEIFAHFHNFEQSLTQAAPILRKHQQHTLIIGIKF